VTIVIGNDRKIERDVTPSEFKIELDIVFTSVPKELTDLFWILAKYYKKFNMCTVSLRMGLELKKLRGKTCEELSMI